MKLDPEEKILLTEEDIKRIDEICKQPVEITEYMLAAIKRYKERYNNETKTQGAEGT